MSSKGDYKGVRIEEPLRVPVYIEGPAKRGVAKHFESLTLEIPWKGQRGKRV